MLIASFDSLKFENIEGYRISCRLKPGRGFDGHFYVYIHERREAKTPFADGVKVSKREGNSITPVRGTLSISDQDRSYEFKDIDLSYAELGATRRERMRYLEFRYDKDVTDAKNADPITIDGKKKSGLTAGGLNDKYMGGVGETRQLLGFRSEVSANDGAVIRFVNLGCLPKSFLAKVVELNKQMQSGDGIIPEFTASFSQGDFKVTPDNFVGMFVEESWGSLMTKSAPPIHKLLEDRVADVERLRTNEFSGNDLLLHDQNKTFHSEDVNPATVEFATLVFKSGVYDELTVV